MAISSQDQALHSLLGSQFERFPVFPIEPGAQDDHRLPLVRFFLSQTGHSPQLTFLGNRTVGGATIAFFEITERVPAARKATLGLSPSLYPFRGKIQVIIDGEPFVVTSESLDTPVIFEPHPLGKEGAKLTVSAARDTSVAVLLETIPHLSVVNPSADAPPESHSAARKLTILQPATREDDDIFLSPTDVTTEYIHI